MADILLDEQSVPSAPASGQGIIYPDSGNSSLTYVTDGGVRHAVGRGVMQSSTAAVAMASGAETYLSNSGLVIPSFGLVTGAEFRWTWSMSKTAAGTAAPVFNIKIGSAGTTADTTRLALTGPAQTAAVDTALYEITAQLRAAGASAVLVAAIHAHHTAATGAGFGTNSTTGGYQLGTSAAFDSTTAVGGWFVGLSLAPGSSAVWTVDFGLHEGYF